MESPFGGFWQVVIDDPDETIQSTARTTIAVRASGCSIYAGGHYMEFRASKARPLATSLPLSEEDASAMFRAHRATGGRVSFDGSGDGILIRHEPTIAVDPRHLQPFTITLRVTAEGAAVAEGSPGSTGGASERWRRLSRAAERPAAGAWESVDEEERYLYLVTQGHYGVMRTPIEPGSAADAARTDRDLSMAEEAELFAASSFNGGARLLATRTLDHWPMFASTYGYEVNKHPTFYVAALTDSELQLSFDPEEPPTSWRRLG